MLYRNKQKGGADSGRSREHSEELFQSFINDLGLDRKAAVNVTQYGKIYFANRAVMGYMEGMRGKDAEQLEGCLCQYP